jgi:hypothetical protein
VFLNNRVSISIFNPITAYLIQSVLLFWLAMIAFDSSFWIRPAKSISRSFKVSRADSLATRVTSSNARPTRSWAKVTRSASRKKW